MPACVVPQLCGPLNDESGMWLRLHRLAYAAAPLAAVHWILALKVWESKPLLILTVILLILALRLLRLHLIGAGLSQKRHKI